MPGLSPNQLNSASNVDNQQNEILSEKQSLTRLQNENRIQSPSSG